MDQGERRNQCGYKLPKNKTRFYFRKHNTPKKRSALPVDWTSLAPDQMHPE